MPPSAGTLFVCATPIGHFMDCSERLLATLRSVAHIAAEDTRVTQVLLRHFGIEAPLVSLQQFNEAARVKTIVGWLSSGKDVALVSDAGTPGVSDPGALLVNAVAREGFRVSPIPGPSSIMALLSVSGLSADTFYFGGFFPRKLAEALALLSRLQGLGVTIGFLESPKRIVETITLLAMHYPEARVVLGKELTKTFEWVFHGTSRAALDALSSIIVKGEWCFSVSLPKPSLDVLDVVSSLKSEGLGLSQVLFVTQTYLHLPKNAVYKAFHEEVRHD